MIFRNAEYRDDFPTCTSCGERVPHRASFCEFCALGDPIHLSSEQLEDMELRGFDCVEQLDGRFIVKACRDPA